jgi:antitoxin component of MazEF toxin-antitoxin module
LKVGDSIELNVDGPGAVKLLKREKKLTLKDLLEGINADNLHGETDWAEQRGNEVW